MWRKLGLLYSPEHYTDRHPKLLTHAANPLALHLDGNVFRVFYSGRDSQNRGSIGVVDIDVVSGTIVEDHYSPVLEVGEPGSYYSHGISLGNSYTVGSETFIGFTGWQLKEDSVFHHKLGRILVRPDKTLFVEADSVILTPEKAESLALGFPCVMRNECGKYIMWYASVKKWDAGNGARLYPIDYAVSDDGLNWQYRGLAVPYEMGVAQYFARPTVIIDNGTYKMWFSYRGDHRSMYRIGYAEGADAYNWKLNTQHAGIDVSAEGWDSEMIEYPYVFIHGGERYMLYNGNEYGKTGFGLAVWTEQ